MTWVDLVVFGFLAISGLLAFARGLVREVLGVGAWIGAIAAAFLSLPRMRGIVRNWFATPEWVDPVSFMVVFLLTLIVLMLVARAIGGVVRRSALGGVDRTLGLVFGLVRGAAVVIIAYIIGQMVFPIERWPDVVLEARTLTPTYEAARWVRDQLPEPYRPHALDRPPAGRKTTAEALFRASPQGRATGKQPERE
ncbi:MAG: rane protein required for colicin production [Acetobacteraceae bacterium]|jgi:membrane protein required for colicin V production|nr:rane protein required for colicin production [Acetobacteraceae bacterium]MEA2775511.1 rane protein required for colicin production [Acetobacteraceae bacterium]